MKRLLVAMGLGAAALLAHAQSTPAGLWKQIDDETKQERSLIRIDESGGAFGGRIEKITDPARAGMLCDKCPGDLKDKPMLGLTILHGMTRSPGDTTVWEGGEILDPNNGKTYKARLTLGDGGKTLAVRGYIGMPLLGRTQTWIRAE